jgi:hypothetical protein
LSQLFAKVVYLILSRMMSMLLALLIVLSDFLAVELSTTASMADPHEPPVSS